MENPTKSLLPFFTIQTPPPSNLLYYCPQRFHALLAIVIPVLAPTFF